MIENARGRALVARAVYEMHLENAEDGKSFSSSPYAKCGSLLVRYGPIVRLLSDEDLKILDPPFLMALRWRKNRRKEFLGHVDTLRKEAIRVLAEQVKTGAVDREASQRDWDSVQSALRSLTHAAWLHRFYAQGLPERVTKALLEINAGLWLDRIVPIFPLQDHQARP